MFVFGPRLAALGNFAPRRRQLLPAAAGLRLACATTVRVVNRVARHAATDAANAAMPRTTRLAEKHIFVLRVADLADGRVAIPIHPADFARGQTQLRVSDRKSTRLN